MAEPANRCPACGRPAGRLPGGLCPRCREARGVRLDEAALPAAPTAPPGGRRLTVTLGAIAVVAVAGVASFTHGVAALDGWLHPSEAAEGELTPAGLGARLTLGPGWRHLTRRDEVRHLATRDLAPDRCMTPEQAAAVGTATVRSASWFRGGRPVDPDALLVLGAAEFSSPRMAERLRASFLEVAEAGARQMVQGMARRIPGGRIELRACTAVGFPTAQGARCAGAARVGNAERGVTAYMWPTGRGIGLAVVLTRETAAAEPTAEALVRGFALVD